MSSDATELQDTTAKAKHEASEEPEKTIRRDGNSKVLSLDTEINSQDLAHEDQNDKFFDDELFQRPTDLTL